MSAGFLAGGAGILLWKKAVATAVLAITNVLLVNIIDPAHQLYSWEWVRHMLFASALSILMFEGRFWRDWANKILGNGENGVH